MVRNTIRKRATITQVAQLAGVSNGTVSNLLNGTAPVSRETAQRITDAIKALNYVPDVMASSLRRGNSRIIQVLTPNMNNTFYTRVLSSFTDSAYPQGYFVNVFGYEYSAERERRLLANTGSSMTGAVIVFNGYGDEDEIEALVRRGVPVILADRETEIDGVPCVAFDNKKVFGDIVQELMNRGYRRIGLFTEPPSLENVKARCASFRAAIIKYGYEFDDHSVFSRDDLCLDNLKNGCAFMKEILQTHDKSELPDAWIASSDVLAIGMLQAIRECNYRVPDDFGVVGFDNIDVSGYVNPKLTTVEQDQERFGRELWAMVSKVLKGEHPVGNVILPQRLIIRESC